MLDDLTAISQSLAQWLGVPVVWTPYAVPVRGDRVELSITTIEPTAESPAFNALTISAVVFLTGPQRSGEAMYTRILSYFNKLVKYPRQDFCNTRNAIFNIEPFYGENDEFTMTINFEFTAHLSALNS